MDERKDIRVPTEQDISPAWLDVDIQSYIFYGLWDFAEATYTGKFWADQSTVISYVTAALKEYQAIILGSTMDYDNKMDEWLIRVIRFRQWLWD